MHRTHHCGELTQADAGRDVTLVGWINAVRDHGGLVFVDLRDREGLTQVVLDPQNAAMAATLPSLRDESVIEVTGRVKPRPVETINAKLSTGHIEVEAQKITIHNVCATLPFPLEDDKADKVNEDLRLTYRYLDLRRPQSLALLKLRHRASQTVRTYLDEQGFLEVETPMLFKSTPEGAREFLVPSRLNPGQFYALSQSPQQYKQILMVAGVERYYSLAKCFRDEDLRADRQPEFTQIDLEMSFIEREDIYALIEGMLAARLESRPQPRHAHALPAPRLPRRHEPLRRGQARHALRPRTGGPVRRFQKLHLQGFLPARCRPAAWSRPSTRRASPTSRRAK